MKEKGRGRIESGICHSIAQNDACFCEVSRVLRSMVHLCKRATVDGN